VSRSASIAHALLTSDSSNTWRASIWPSLS
jgi:hypothetical protein